MMVLFSLDDDLLSFCIWLLYIYLSMKWQGGGVDCSCMIGHPRLMMILFLFSCGNVPKGRMAGVALFIPHSQDKDNPTKSSGKLG